MNLLLAVATTNLMVQGLSETDKAQIFASTDLQTWKPRAELAAQERLPLNPGTTEFYRARLKPRPAGIIFSSPTVNTGRLFKARGTASALLVNVGDLLVTHQEMGLTNGRPGIIYCEWEYPTRALPLGTNVLTFDFLDANNNHVDTNFTVNVLPGAPLTIDQPKDGSLVAGDTTAILGHVDDLSAVVILGNRSTVVQEDGSFFFTGLAVSETNTVTVASGTNSVTVSFGKSRIPFNGNISGRTLHGTTDPVNRLNIGGKRVTPSADGSWNVELPMPPAKGMLPFSISTPSGESASGVITSSYDSSGYYLTSHSIYYHYEYENKFDTDEHWKQYSGWLSRNMDVRYSMMKHFYPNKKSCPGDCSSDYTGQNPFLWLDEEEGPCNAAAWRIYPGAFNICNYSDETSDKWYFHDALEITESSSCGLHIGGSSSRRFRLAVQVSLTRTLRDGWAADEPTSSAPCSTGCIGYIGGFPVDSSGIVYFNVEEGRNYNITPSLFPLNTGWFEYEFDWNEVPISPL